MLLNKKKYLHYCEVIVLKISKKLNREYISIIIVYICFSDEPERRHLFAARAEDNVVQWVMKLRTCSYEYLRGQLYALQSKIFSITGKVSY